ncbi:MAG: chemotaxis protein CheX [Magnetococcales bacterium]|nr:chemotaxis protein CheX [Magnetococcales bacterium]
MIEELGSIIRTAIKETVLAFFVADIALEPGPVIVKSGDADYRPPHADVTAIVGFGGALKGGVHLSAPSHAALGLASAFSGEHLDQFNAVFRDAFGELANIVAGAVKGLLNDAIALNPPQVVVESGLNNVYAPSLEYTKCYFMTRNGPFFIEVFYADN